MNNYFCVLPFYGLEYFRSGNISPCCHLPSNIDIKQLQTEMLTGIRPVACQTCWNLEDQEKVSDRQLKNSSFDFYTNKDIQYIEEDCQQGKFSPKIIKLYTSNLCNSTCVTCNAAASTAWGTLKKNKYFRQIKINTIETKFKYNEIVILSFVGGEPLIEQKNFDILEQLILVGNTDCYISFVTNGSIQLTQRQQTILKQFKNLNICLSIDGIEKRFEYIRFPLKWTTLLENIDFFNLLNINLSVSYTISNLNIFYYNETINWFKQQGLTYNYNIVENPTYFSINALPEKIKLELNQDLFNSHSINDDKNFSKFLIEIQQQDQLKNISMKDYLPEFYKIIKENS
jgi:hypothetical protein